MNDAHDSAQTDREALLQAMARAWWGGDGYANAPSLKLRMRRLLSGEIAGDDLSVHDRRALDVLARGPDDGDHAGDDYRRERERYTGGFVITADREALARNGEGR